MSKREKLATRRAYDRSKENRAREQKLYRSRIYRKARKLGITVTALRRQMKRAS
jgi:hypothetical protein